MTNLKRQIGIVLCGAAWAGLYWLFLRLEKTVEPQLFANGQQGKWWGIVLLYWIVDAIVLTCLAWFVRRPLGFRLPQNFPFFQYGADVFIVILFVHFGWFCTDARIYPSLYSAGLSLLPWVFISLALGWGIVAVMRYRQIITIMNRQMQQVGSA